MMLFGAPVYLWLLALVPALAVFLWWSWRVRQRLQTTFIHPRLLPGLLAGVSLRRYQLRGALLLAAVALLALVLARPRWGFHLEEVRQRGLDIIVALDTSRSMLASDVTPDRLARSKLEIQALQQLCRADRLGLVAFAGTAFLQCPLSLDDDAFRQALEVLDTTIIPQGGTALAEAIRTAQTAFKAGDDNHKVLVIFSDGEDHDGQAVAAAREAAGQGLRIFTIGVGSANGELISVVDEQGHRSFLKDPDGNVVKSRLNEALLQEIAAAGNGFYLPLSGARTMDTLYERGLSRLPRGESETRTVRQYHERFQWFLAAALVVLLIEMLLPDARLNTARPADTAGHGTATTAAVLLLGLLTAATTGQAASASQALSDYRRGNFSKAYRAYERLAERDPKDPRLQYNAGAAAYQDGDFEEAIKRFSASLATPDLRLQQQAFYNLGNAHYRAGQAASDPQQTMSQWRQAITQYESALKLDPKDADAQFNLELVKQKLEELQQRQQQQGQNQDPQNKQDNQNQDSPSQDQQKQQDQQSQEQQQNQQGQQSQPENQPSGAQKDQPQDAQSKPPEQNPQGQQPQPRPGQDSNNQQTPQPGQQAQPAQEGKEPGKDQDQAAVQAAPMLRMSPDQARQLLDAQRADEKPMPFWRLLRTNRQERIFKDW